MGSRVFLRYGITFVIASSIVFNGLPVSAEPGNMQWTAQDLPKQGNRGVLNGSSVVDIAVANDGQTIYVVDPDSGLPVLKSVDGGQQFKEIINTYGGSAPVAIAVAPDDVKTVAVTDGTNVYITSDGGATWSALPGPLTGIYTGARITDVAVSPAVSGSLLGRLYAISLADPIGVETCLTAGGVITRRAGDILVFGKNAAWASAGAANVASPPTSANQITGVFDFTSVVFTPNFSADRCLVAVGTRASAGSTAVFIINTATNSIINNPPGAATPTGTLLRPGGTTTDYGVIGAGIASSAVALPADFDATIAGGRFGFTGIASGSTYTDNDVYRFEDNAARALGATTALPVHSLDYSGTIKSGVLFAGMKNSAAVKYTKDVTSNSPEWTASLKSPFGSTKTVVRVAPDFPATNRVFAGTSGTPSAFFVSNNRGVSFDGEALINNGGTSIGAIDGIELSSDGAWLYVATHTAGFIFLYRSITPVTITSWSLIMAKAKSGPQGLLEINRNWPNTPSVYLADKSAGGSIYVSTDTGNTFSAYSAPAGITPSAMAAPGGATVYLAGGPTGSSIFRSVNSAFFWDKQADSGISGITSIAVPVTGTIIAGGDGAVAYSTDGGNSFTRIDAGLAPAPVNYQVAADTDYVTSKMVFAGGSVTAAPGNIYRYIIGTSDKWENTQNGATIPGAVIGMSAKRGAVYAMGGSSAARSINPLAANGNLPSFLSMKTGGVTGAKWLTTVGLPTANILYAANDVAAPLLWAFNDWLAFTKPVLVSPPDKYSLPVNPVTGFAEDVTFTWQPVGSGSGLVNTIDFEIYRKTPQLDAGKTVTKIPVNPSNPFVRIVAGGTTAGNVIGYTMQPGQEYVWDIRFSDTANGSGLTSRWCDSRAVTVQTGGKVTQQYEGPQLTGPAPGATGLNPDALGFTWASVSGATEYQVIIATDAGLSQYVGGTPANVTGTAYRAGGLEYGITYFWAVRAVKPVESVQVVGTFTTMPKPAPRLSASPAPTGSTTPPIDFVTPVPTELPLFIWGVLAIGVFLLVTLIIRFSLRGGRK